MTSTAKIARKIAKARPGEAFTPDDFGSLASPTAVATALSRLSKRGVIDRARKGIYYKPLLSRFGRGRIPTDIVAHMVTEGKAPGPAGPSAAQALGFTTQIPVHSTIAVVGNRPKGLTNVRFIERSNVGRVTAKLRPMEVALLEVIRDKMKWAEISDSDAKLKILNLVANGEINIAKVLRAAKREPRRVETKLRELILD